MIGYRREIPGYGRLLRSLAAEDLLAAVA